MERAELYRDIAKRTQGDIYIGVVGPVRTGKSTFIKRFMDLLVVPNIENEHVRERLVDELPQSGSGKTIMTTQPKFVPNEAVELTLDDTMGFRVRMVDCVGYMVEGAIGHTENESARMVRTPWFDYDIPFDEAAEIGTKKVITEHSTIGIVMTTDGSISGIDREAYAVCEERVVRELQEQGKPFIVVLNSIHPEDPDTVSLCEKLSERYGAVVKPSDVLNMGIDEINGLLESLLAEFPIKLIRIDTPSWIRALGPSHWLTKEALDAVSECAGRMAKMRDYSALTETVIQRIIADQHSLKLAGIHNIFNIISLHMGGKNDIADETFCFRVLKKSIHCLHMLLPGFQAQHTPHMIKIYVIRLQPVKGHFQTASENILIRLLRLQCIKIGLRGNKYLLSVHLRKSNSRYNLTLIITVKWRRVPVIDSLFVSIKRNLRTLFQAAFLNIFRIIPHRPKPDCRDLHIRIPILFIIHFLTLLSFFTTSIDRYSPHPPDSMVQILRSFRSPHHHNNRYVPASQCPLL